MHIKQVEWIMALGKFKINLITVVITLNIYIFSLKFYLKVLSCWFFCLYFLLILPYDELFPYMVVAYQFCFVFWGEGAENDCSYFPVGASRTGWFLFCCVLFFLLSYIWHPIFCKFKMCIILTWYTYTAIWLPW